MSVDGSIFENIAGALREVRLDAIVVGNAASELHGAPIATEDVDLLVRDSRLNRQKLRKLVERLGGVGMTDIHEFITAKRIHLPDYFVDILFDKIAGKLTFNSLRSRSIKMTIGEQTLTVASLEDVIRSKEAAGREKDLAVLPILRRTLAVQKAQARK
jgi:hypothetical protein